MQITLIEAYGDPKRPGRGGLSDLNWRLARELAGLGEQVNVVGPYEGNTHGPDPCVGFVPVPSALTRRNNIAKMMIRALRLANEARRHPAEIYQVTDSVMAAACCLLGLGRRLVWVGHSNVLHYSQHGNPWDRQSYMLMRMATAYAAPRTARVVALGPSLKHWWVRAGFPIERVAVIPNGVDLPPTPSQAAESGSFAAWQGRRYRLLFVGRLAADKGGSIELVEAVSDLTNRLSVGLVIMGDGHLRPAVEHAIARNRVAKHIDCVGQQPSDVVHRAYRDADLVILPSRAETMPRVMLEAWAAGTAFLATPVGAVPDYLEDERNGFLIASTERETFSAQLQTLLLDEGRRARVAAAGHATAASLSWANVAEQFRSVYRLTALEAELHA